MIGTYTEKTHTHAIYFKSFTSQHVYIFVGTYENYEKKIHKSAFNRPFFDWCIVCWCTRPLNSNKRKKLAPDKKNARRVVRLYQLGSLKGADPPLRLKRFDWFKLYSC